MVSGAVAFGHGRDDDRGAQPGGGARRAASSSIAPGSASTTSSRSRGAWAARVSRWFAAEKPAVSPGLDVEGEQSAGPGVVEGRPQGRHHQVWHDEVNHEPGPRMTQSASSNGAHGGRRQREGPAGSSAMLRTRPVVGRPPPGRARWRPRRATVPVSALATSASISSGTAAMGRTRPRALSRRATRSRPATGSSWWRSQRATMRRFPSA